MITCTFTSDDEWDSLSKLIIICTNIEVLIIINRRVALYSFLNDFKLLQCNSVKKVKFWNKGHNIILQAKSPIQTFAKLWHFRVPSMR